MSRTWSNTFFAGGMPWAVPSACGRWASGRATVSPPDCGNGTRLVGAGAKCPQKRDEGHLRETFKALKREHLPPTPTRQRLGTAACLSTKETKYYSCPPSSCFPSGFSPHFLCSPLVSFLLSSPLVFFPWPRGKTCAVFRCYVRRRSACAAAATGPRLLRTLAQGRALFRSFSSGGVAFGLRVPGCEGGLPPKPSAASNPCKTFRTLHWLWAPLQSALQRSPRKKEKHFGSDLRNIYFFGHLQLHTPPIFALLNKPYFILGA